MNAYFDRAAFLQALNSIRMGRQATWRTVAEESGVSLHNLHKYCQARETRNPSMDIFVRLIAWAGLDANAFIVRHVGSERTA